MPCSARLAEGTGGERTRLRAVWSVERWRGQPLVDPRLLARPAVGVIYVDL